MNSKSYAFVVLCVCLISSTLLSCGVFMNKNMEVRSPDGQIRAVLTAKDGKLNYSVQYKGKQVVESSQLGVTFSAGSIDQNLIVVKTTKDQKDETWTQPWGEVKEIENRYNELRILVKTQDASELEMAVVFRVFDDGVGFRYEWPEQSGLDNFVITNEATQFVLNGNPKAWWIGAYQAERFEYLFQDTPVSELDVVHTPVTFERDDGIVFAIHEAALTDYSSMTLRRKEGSTLKADLIPWGDGTLVKGKTPHISPWRMILIGESAGDLATSTLMLNLNEPSKLEDTSWIKPGKYVGIWWGMHLEKYTWGRGLKHGATNRITKRYIDFAAEHGFDGVLVEGWNYGWDAEWWKDGSGFSFTKAYPDFNIKKLSAYAQEKGVRLIGHHETGAAVVNYEKQLEDAFDLYEELGVRAVKTGYVGAGQTIVWTDENGNEHKEWHHGQFMVRHYRRVIEAAAKRKIMLDVHEPIKDTGIRRTWPNMMTREGARGQEYNAWSPDGGNPPEHTTVIPFTRGLCAPFDFTPGIFGLTYPEIKPNNRVNTTLAKQLALYVVIYSPLHMAADLPENYEGKPAFQFIKDVPTDWETTQVPAAKIGDYAVFVRKDRHSENWYLGAVTDEEARTIEIELDFLDTGKTYMAEVYEDAPGADWETNPYPITIRQADVKSGDTWKIVLAAGGGQAVRFAVK